MSKSVIQCDMESDDFTFDALIHPQPRDTFFQEYWEQRPLHLSGRGPAYYTDLFSSSQLESVMIYSQTMPPDLRVVCEQKEMLPSRYITDDGRLNINQLYKAYDEGHTLIINGLQRFSSSLAAFCQHLQGVFSFKVIANAYLTPAKSRALAPHYDTHDVFVLQVEGAKTWKLYPPYQETPLLGSFQPVFADEQLPKPSDVIELAAGDLLYVPRGHVHQAETGLTSSLHLTIGVYPIQWCDFMIHSITSLGLKELQLRKALPVGFLDRPEARAEIAAQFRKLSKLIYKQASADDALELLAEKIIRQTEPVADGHFKQVDDSHALALETTVAKRNGMKCRIIRSPDATRIQFPGNTIKATPLYGEALQFVADTKTPFLIGSMPESLDDGRKLGLARRLLRGGLLRIVERNTGSEGTPA